MAVLPPNVDVDETFNVPFKSKLSLISTSPEVESRINLSLVVLTVFPSILTLSISALPLTSKILATVRLLLILTLLSNCDVPSTFRVPSTSNESANTLTIWAVASRNKDPDAVVMVLSSLAPVPLAITTSPMCASENGNDAVPRYAPSSASGTIPVLNTACPANIDVEETFNVPFKSKLSLISTSPEAELRIKSPVLVSIVLSLVIAI